MPELDHDLLVRIDERTTAFANAIPNFVTKQEFKPVKNVVYGLVGIVLVTVVTAIVASILKK